MCMQKELHRDARIKRGDAGAHHSREEMLERITALEAEYIRLVVEQFQIFTLELSTTSDAGPAQNP